MILNLSNHPSNRWSNQQLETALATYGKVEDLAFPNIPPHATSDEVGQMVEEYEHIVRKLDPTAVHLMGEMTFTHALVNRLQAIGIPCVASTTERKVLEEKDGKKTMQFDFIQFRAYF